MQRGIRLGILVLMCLSLAASLPPVQAQTPRRTRPAPSSGKTIVLDITSPWRLYQALKPPVIRTDGGLEPVVLGQKWLNWETPEPPADWTSADFDDSTWLRGPPSRLCKTACLERLCLRGRFNVTNPAAVKGLAVSLEYFGGAVVYVNGQPVARGHMPEGARGKGLIAQDYPAEAFVTEGGGYLAPAGAYLNGKPSGKPSAESERRLALRNRSIESVAIPPRLLRRGTNVLAVEIVRAPYHKVMETVKGTGMAFPHEFTWYTCDLHRVQLTAEDDDGLESSAERPKGLQVWNSDVLDGDFDLDFGNPAETPRPVSIVGARNGSFSGKIVVGSSRPIADLAARAGPLKGPAETIPASAVRIRYALPWGGQTLTDQTYHGQPFPYPASPTLMDLLADSPPKEVPVHDKQARSGPPLVPGAAIPIWVTVKVPKEVAAGVYSGQVTVALRGERPVNVPLRLEVADWTLPDPDDYRTWIELMQSPDTLAMEYDVPLWSDRHWALIARSMDFLGEIGSRVVYVPLLAHTNLGNAESMVRWVELGRDKFRYDFSIMDKYLDLAEKHMGKPRIVVFNVWDVYLIPKQGATTSGGTGGHRRMVQSFGNNQKYGLGPLVTVVDPKSGKTENAYLPSHFEPQSKALWQPLMAQVREHMKSRGLDKAMMLGMVTDALPSKEEVQLFADIAPGVPWVSHGHGGFQPNGLLHKLTPVGYQACVWHTQFADGVPTHGQTWPEESLHGWKQSQLTVAFERNTGLDGWPLTRWLHMGETNITGAQRGCGRLGADYWPVVKDDRGRRRGRIYERFPESLWMNLNIPNALLAPAADGPAATTRFEALRLGIQECEARIFIEQALTGEAMKARLGADLARRCQETLDERMRVMWKSLSNLQLTGPGWANATGWRWSPGVSGHAWFLGSDWQERTRKLYGLAGEVRQKVMRR